MQVQVNVKSAATRVKKFIEAAGGSTTHSEVLELMSEVCGFDSYRALKAAAAPVAKASGSAVSVKAVASAEQEYRPLESAGNVVFSATAVDWQLAGNPTLGLAEVPQERRTPYDFIVEQAGSQFRVLLKPVGIHLDNFEGKPVLDMLVEVNEGLPCVHMTNDPADAMLATVFATGQGLLIREDGGDWMRGWDAGPRELLNLADRLTEGFTDAEVRDKQLNEIHLVALDTDEKYHEEPAVHTPQSVAPVRLPAMRTFPHARTDLVHPVRRQHVGSYVEVKFEPSVTDGGVLGISVELFDEEGVCGDEDSLELSTKLSTEAPADQLKKLADNLAQLAAFFFEAGYDATDLAVIFESIAANKEAVAKSEQAWALAMNQETREQAYVSLTVDVLM